MADRIRVACVQMTSRQDKAADLERGESLVARAAATRADVVVLPRRDTDIWHVLLGARAIETQSYLAAAAEVGETIAGRRPYGRSLIVDPWGIVLAQAREEETVVTAEIDRARLRDIRAKLPSLAN